MCLYISNSVKINFDKHGYVTAYKVVHINTNRSPSFGAKYIVGKTVNAYDRNRHKVKARLTATEIRENEVNSGLHVFLNKNAAFRESGYGYKVLVVKGHKNDLRAVGSNNGQSHGAVFTKLKVIKALKF